MITDFKMTTIDFRTMPANIPSLCIPRVFPNIDERRIRCIFSSLNMGEIARVDIIRRKTEKGENFNRVFIHWTRWNDSENANKSRERLLNGKEIKIIYDDPWFWKISAYREVVQRQIKPAFAEGVPRLQFDSDEDKVPNDTRPNQRPRQRDDTRPNQRDDTRPNQRPRQRNDTRPRQRPNQKDERSPIKIPEVNTFAPTTPNCSPPKPERLDNEVSSYDVDKVVSKSVQLEYGNLPPPQKKLNFKTKKPLVLDEEEIKE